MPEHKIQSSNDILTINLYPVKKDLYKIKTEWNPKSFLISFKLETDEEILLKKTYKAIEKSYSDYVIANILETRYDKVLIINKMSKYDILKNENEFIEENLIQKICELHEIYISDNRD